VPAGRAAVVPERRRRRAPRILPAVLASAPALLLPGCFWFTSARAGEELRADVDSLRIDVDTMRQSLDVERARFAEMVAEAQRQVEQLDVVLQRTTELLTRNSADFGAEFDELKDEVRRIQGRLEELTQAIRGMETASATQTRRLDRLERAAGLDPEIDPEEAPATADELWARAQELQAQENYGTARAYYRLFVSRYAEDARAAQAETEIGVAYAQEGRFADAVARLSDVARRRPDAPDADRVYYFTALSLFGLSRCDEARSLLRAMLRKYPESALKASAEQLLEQIRTAPQCR
jgi:TolA-binding protein